MAEEFDSLEYEQTQFGLKWYIVEMHRWCTVDIQHPQREKPQAESFLQKILKFTPEQQFWTDRKMSRVGADVRHTLHVIWVFGELEQ